MNDCRLKMFSLPHGTNMRQIARWSLGYTKKTLKKQTPVDPLCLYLLGPHDLWAANSASTVCSHCKQLKKETRGPFIFLRRETFCLSSTVFDFGKLAAAKTLHCVALQQQITSERHYSR